MGRFMFSFFSLVSSLHFSFTYMATFYHKDAGTSAASLVCLSIYIPALNKYLLPPAMPSALSPVPSRLLPMTRCSLSCASLDASLTRHCDAAYARSFSPTQDPECAVLPFSLFPHSSCTPPT